LTNKQYIKKYLKLKTNIVNSAQCVAVLFGIAISHVITINFQKTDYEIRLLRIKFNYSFIIRKDIQILFLHDIFFYLFFLPILFLPIRTVAAKN